MVKLKLSDWANISEIITSVVIVASLVYVAIELKQNTQALQQSSYQTALDALSNGDMTLATNTEMHRIVKAAEQTPDEVSEENWSRFKHFMYPRVGAWEFAYIGYRNGSIHESHWFAINSYFSNLYCLPGYKRFFEETRVAWAPEFLEHIANEVEPACTIQAH